MQKKEYKVSIDCAGCAKEVEEMLNDRSDVKNAVFNYAKGSLTLETSLSDEEIKKICRETEEDMEFLSSSTVSYLFNVEIDCADCARKVEEALKESQGVEKAFFDFPKGKLHVTSSLSEKEIMKICKDVEDDMVFHSSSLEEKKDYSLLRIALSVVLLALSYAVNLPLLAIIGYAISGYDVLIKAIRNIAKGKIFDENFLMAIATIAALSVRSFDEAAAVMVFYQIGEYFQNKATRKSRDSIGKLLDLSTESVMVKENGEWKEKDPEEVAEGSLVMVKGGEKIALDGVVEEGSGYLDTRALTGETMPQEVKKGDSVLSGSVNGESTLIIRTTSVYSESTATKIMKLVEEGEGKKAESEKFITLFSRYYTPAVCVSALLLALLSPAFGVSWSESIYRASMLLVISCPCALVLSVPLSYFASMGAFAKSGILVKGDDAIQKLSKISIFALDKTGTLTEGVFSVQGVEHLSVDMDYLVSRAKALEKESTHPIATAILSLEGKEAEAKEVKTISGIGMEGIVEGKIVRVGSDRIGEGLPLIQAGGTHIYVTEDGKLLGVFVITDSIRKEAKETMVRLKDLGVRKTYILSGDREERVRDTAKSIGMDGYYAQLLPHEKLEKMENLKKEGLLCYCGDGINDAPTLKMADVGFAMGGVGSDSAIASCDAVIMDDNLKKLPLAIAIARKTETIVKENIVFSLSVKALVFLLALMGMGNMWLAVVADTGVSLIAVVNALRALYVKKNY